MIKKTLLLLAASLWGLFTAAAQHRITSYNVCYTKLLRYMGETNGRWPQHSVASGLLDQAGFPKPPYYMYKTLWSNDDVMYICSQTAEKSLYKVNEEGKVVENNFV